MKEVAILLLLALMLNGCGSNSTPTQTAAGGTWQVQTVGGEAASTGFSFNTQFTVSGDGTLTISYFQFINSGQPCFAFTGDTVSGQMVLTENTVTYQVTGTFNYVVQSGSNKLTLTSDDVTGTENGLTGTTLSGITANGTWTLAGDGTNGCVDTSGTFTMSQS
jgi:hypothetical protein